MLGMAPRTARKTANTLPSRREAEREGKSARAPRAIWSGTISFGMVSIPVNLCPAARGVGADGARSRGQGGDPRQGEPLPGTAISGRVDHGDDALRERDPINTGHHGRWGGGLAQRTADGGLVDRESER